jgi:hypothetical protein
MTAESAPCNYSATLLEPKLEGNARSFPCYKIPERGDCPKRPEATLPCRVAHACTLLPNDKSASWKLALPTRAHGTTASVRSFLSPPSSSVWKLLPFAFRITLPVWRNTAVPAVRSSGRLAWFEAAGSPQQVRPLAGWKPALQDRPEACVTARP